MRNNASSAVEAARKIEMDRRQKLMELNEDPFIGYKDLDESLADAKCSTQTEVLARLLNRENVFISGPAGSGKTTIVKRFIDIIDAEYGGKFNVALTASTGIAAQLIEGQTIHSWGGLGIDTEPFNVKKIPPMMWNKRPALKYADVLIIDEISMLPAYLFEKLDAILKYFRRNKKPFGGVQLVILGDFLQLPPVSKKEDGDIDTGYAITSDSWKAAGIKHCYMDKTHRATDPKLKYLLNKISRNEMDDAARQIVQSRVGAKKDPNKTYTTLFTTNKNVDTFNNAELAKNPNSPKLLRAERAGGSAKDIEKIFKNQNVLEELTLKIGATVMLTSNTQDQTTGRFYANGSIGKVESFSGDIPRVRFNDGGAIFIEKKEYNLTGKISVKDHLQKNKPRFGVPTLIDVDDSMMDEVLATVRQIPLKLGYAITVHKSQGQTFDGVVTDLSKCFTPGLGYVALSRVRSLDDLVILDINDSAFEVDPKSLRITKAVKKRGLKSRGEFIEGREQYESLLTDSLFRMIVWPEDEAGSNRQATEDAKKKF